MRLLSILILHIAILLSCVFQNVVAEHPILQIDPGGHQALIRDVAFTPDGRYLVSAGDDKIIRVWDLNTGSTVRTLRGQINMGRQGKVYAMALSPNGRWLAVAGWMAGNTAAEWTSIRLYDFASGELVALLKGHNNVIFSLAFSPNNRFLVSGSADKTAIIWDVAGQQRLHTLRGHTDRVQAVAFTPNSQRVVTGGNNDRTLRLWRVPDGSLIATMFGHTDKVVAVAISPLTGIIASGSFDHTIRLWNGLTGHFIKTLANQGTTVGSLSFSPNGRYLVSGVAEQSSNKRCHVWSIYENKELISYKGHDNVVIATAVSPDGRWVATGGGDDHEIHVWSLYNGKRVRRMMGSGTSVWAVSFSTDGQTLAWGRKPIRRYNEHGKLEYSIDLPTSASPLGQPVPLKNSYLSSILGWGKSLLGASKNFSGAQNRWRDWYLRSRTSSNSRRRHTILDIRHKGKIVANITRNRTNGHDHRAYTFTPDGRYIISGGSNGWLSIYDRSGKKLGDYVGHTGVIWAVAVSPDGSLLASGGADQTVRLWNVQSRENLLTLFHNVKGGWIAWTPTGHYLKSSSCKSMVGWHINQGVEKAALFIQANHRQNLNRPDIVANTVRLRSNRRAVEQAKGVFDLDKLILNYNRYQISSF